VRRERIEGTPKRGDLRSEKWIVGELVEEVGCVCLNSKKQSSEDGR
jgi:hypothetical protein